MCTKQALRKEPMFFDSCWNELQLIWWFVAGVCACVYVCTDAMLACFMEQFV